MLEFLSPVSKTVSEHREMLSETVLGRQMLVYTERDGFPDLEKCRFALMGVRESRNSEGYNGVHPSFDNIRNAFYSLYAGNWHFSIADIGDIQPGETVEDTHYALREVIKELISQKIIPLILGGGQDLLYSVYRSYDDLGKMINIVNIDSKFDIGNAEAAISNRSYIGKIVVDKPYNLFNYSVIGYQTYFNSPEEISLIEKLYFEAYRLGEVTADLSIVEPVTRDADIIGIDISAIKSAEISYKAGDSPNGFDGREICAIARYSGLSNKVSSFGVFDIQDRVEDAGAMLIAQILWYFAEGVNFRLDDGNFKSDNDFITYRVPVEESILVFKKSVRTERWWIELPFNSEVNNKLKRHTLIPCTYRDYENACNQEIPERWYKARRKNEI
jgi:arginase family enzyme